VASSGRNVKVYVEGGGDSNANLSACRLAFTHLFGPIAEEAEQIGSRLEFVAAGSRESAYRKYSIACKEFPDRVNVLLVDSEDPLGSAQPNERNPLWRHVRERDRWSMPSRSSDRKLLLMVTSTETWILLDVAALRTKYGACLRISDPDPRTIERISRQSALKLLENATSGCRAPYSKIHAFDILPHVKLSTLKLIPNGERTINLLRMHLGLKIDKVQNR